MCWANFFSANFDDKFFLVNFFSAKLFFLWKYFFVENFFFGKIFFWQTFFFGNFFFGNIFFRQKKNFGKIFFSAKFFFGKFFFRQFFFWQIIFLTFFFPGKNPFSMIPGTYVYILVKIGSITAEILHTLSLYGGWGGVHSDFRVQPSTTVGLRLHCSWVGVLTIEVLPTKKYISGKTKCFKTKTRTSGTHPTLKENYIIIY